MKGHDSLWDYKVSSAKKNQYFVRLASSSWRISNYGVIYDDSIAVNAKYIKIQVYCPFNLIIYTLTDARQSSRTVNKGTLILVHFAQSTLLWTHIRHSSFQSLFAYYTTIKIWIHSYWRSWERAMIAVPDRIVCMWEPPVGAISLLFCTPKTCFAQAKAPRRAESKCAFLSAWFKREVSSFFLCT